MRVLSRFLLAACTGIMVLLLGVLGATVLGGFALLERAASSSGGFLILEFVAIGVLICVPMAIAAACWVLFRPESKSSEVLTTGRGGLFLGR